MTRSRRKGPKSPPLVPPSVPSLRLTVEELSHRTGVTVRNLRQLQTHGLLRPPHLEGRKGFYDERHLARVHLVHRLQARGYSLSSIGDLLARWEEGAGMPAVLGLEEAVTAPLAGVPQNLSEAEVWALLPELRASAPLRRRALEAGLLLERSGSLMAPNAELLEIGRAMVDGGLPLDTVMGELEFLRHANEAVVARMLAVFQKHVIEPLMTKGLPASKVAAMAESLRRLRPMAVRAITLLAADAFERGVVPAAPEASGPPEGSAPPKERKPAGKHKPS